MGWTHCHIVRLGAGPLCSQARRAGRSGEVSGETAVVASSTLAAPPASTSPGTAGAGGSYGVGERQQQHRQADEGPDPRDLRREVPPDHALRLDQDRVDRDDGRGGGAGEVRDERRRSHRRPSPRRDEQHQERDQDRRRWRRCGDGAVDLDEVERVRQHHDGVGRRGDDPTGHQREPKGQGAATGGADAAPPRRQRGAAGHDGERRPREGEHRQRRRDDADAPGEAPTVRGHLEPAEQRHRGQEERDEEEDRQEPVAQHHAEGDPGQREQGRDGDRRGRRATLQTARTPGAAPWSPGSTSPSSAMLTWASTCRSCSRELAGREPSARPWVSASRAVSASGTAAGT